MRIYLDNAATSWPKPSAVYDAVDRCARDVGAAAGRGSYDSSSAAARVVDQARQRVADLVGARAPRRVIFTASGTEALNLAILGFVEPGAHVVTTVCEHNAVLRPLAMLRDSAGVVVDYVSCDGSGVVPPEAVAAALRSDTALVAVTSASNVTGALQDITAIGRVCRERSVPLLVDAAQSLGHAPLDVEADSIAMLAAPGHKGLLGPLGAGLLYLAPGLEERVRPLQWGGTGIQSDQESPPAEAPDRYEAGVLNTPALAGLAAGVHYLATGGPLVEAATAQLIAGLTPLPGVTVFGPPAAVPRAPVVSFTVEDYDPHEVAAILAGAGVECRAGLHCAPRMHRAMGTAELGGAVRLSPGRWTTETDIEQTLAVIRQLAGGA